MAPWLDDWVDAAVRTRCKRLRHPLLSTDGRTKWCVCGEIREKVSA